MEDVICVEGSNQLDEETLVQRSAAFLKVFFKSRGRQHHSFLYFD